MKIIIYFSEDSDISEYEAINKGYRKDVFVTIEKNIYNLNVYSMNRLQEDFKSEMRNYGYFDVEPNLIILEEVNKEEIIQTIFKLFEQRYFDNIKPIIGIDHHDLIRVI